MKSQRSNGWKRSCVGRGATLRDVLKAIEGGGMTVACLVEDDGRLAGIFTDSDVRRAMLKGAALDDVALPYCNDQPFVAPSSATRAELLHLAHDKHISQIPICDQDGRLVDIFFLLAQRGQEGGGEDIAIASGTPQNVKIPNAMFVLAGGLGLRLRSIVNDRPKPLAIVGSRPILATVIQQGVRAGIGRFFVSVNYQADMIEEHLREPEYAGLDIRVIREPSRLGTAGSIGLISKHIGEPLVVCNADVLTTAPYDRLLASHLREGAFATCAVRPHRFTVPYGVADIVDNEIRAIREKPSQTYLVNAGIYVLDPELCRMVEPGQHLDMPELIGRAIACGKKVNPFFLHEYWIDIGRPEEYAQANAEFDAIFGECTE